MNTPASRGSQHFLMTPLYVAITAAVAILVGSAASAHAQSGQTIGVETEKAIVVGQWEKVLELLGPDSVLASPIARMVKGHACLALNRSNESLQSLLEVSLIEDLQSWRAWAGHFAKQNSGSGIAHYLNGDALARLGQWDSAVLAFDEALRIQPDFPLALNARGVARCGQGDWEAAKSDIERATRVAPSFADAYVSLGTYYLYMNQVVAAEEAFDRALHAAPENALAINGRACSEFKQGTKHWDKATEGFAQAGNHLGTFLFWHNADLLTQASAEAMSKANLYFNADDFLQWDSLRQAISNTASALHRYFAGAQLPDQLDRAVADRFNVIMEDSAFYRQNRGLVTGRIRAGTRAADTAFTMDLLSHVEAIGKKDNTNIDAYDRNVIRGLNRAVLEAMYPRWIAPADTTDAGMSLTWNGGLTLGGYANKLSLSNQNLFSGLHRMQYVYRPMATFLQHIPIIGSIGRGWNQHLTNASSMNLAILKSRGVPASMTNPGGATTKEMMALFFRPDDWPVASWFGLGYNVLPRRVGQAAHMEGEQ